MKMLKCDRCGELYDICNEQAFDGIEKAVRQLASIVCKPSRVDQCLEEIEAYFDLCPKCRKKLKDWLKGKEDELDEQPEEHHGTCEVHSGTGQAMPEQ